MTSSAKYHKKSYVQWFETGAARCELHLLGSLGFANPQLVGVRNGDSGKWRQAWEVWLFGFGAKDTLQEVIISLNEQSHIIVQP